jgi:hypothetical protein
MPAAASGMLALPKVLIFGHSFVAPLRQMHALEVQLFAMQFRRLTVTLKFPRKHSCLALVVSERFTIGRLMLLAEMRAGRFVTLQRVNAHQFGEFEEIRNAPGAFQ